MLLVFASQAVPNYFSVEYLGNPSVLFLPFFSLFFIKYNFHASSLV